MSVDVSEPRSIPLPAHEPEAVDEIDSFGVVLPFGWNVLADDLAAFDASCARLRDRWLAEPEFDPSQWDRVDHVVAQLRTQIAGPGARLAAVFLRTVWERGRERTRENAVLVVAGCTFSVVAQGDVANGEGVVEVEPATLVDLPIGTARRVRHRLDDDRHPTSNELFVVPLGADGSLAGLLRFVSANDDLVEYFSIAFGQIASTLTAWTPTDATRYPLPVNVLGGSGQTS